MTIDPVSAILKVIENPLSKKGFQELLQYYTQTNRLQDAEAINYLLKVKFNAEYTNRHTEQ